MIRTIALLSGLAVWMPACAKKDTPAKEAPAAPAPEAPAPEAPAPEAPVPPALPAQADIQHGQVYWGVYFVVAPVDAPAFADAQRRVKAMGLEIFHKDPGCDVPVGEGPPAATGPKAENMLVAAYFEAEADARKVAEAYRQPAPWVGQVKTMCLD